MAGYAADDGAALHFIDGELHAVITSRPQARAYRVIKSGEQVSEMTIGAISSSRSRLLEQYRKIFTKRQGLM